MDKSLRHASNEQLQNFPLKLAIAQIVGEMPPFSMKGAKCFADLDEVTRSEIEDWCCRKIVDTAFGYWMTGYSVVNAAEILVKQAVGNGNIHANLNEFPAKRTAANPDDPINLEDFALQKAEVRDRETARQVADYERGLPYWLKCKDGYCPTP